MNIRTEDGELVEDAMEPGTDAVEHMAASDGVEAQQMSETVLDHQLNNKGGGKNKISSMNPPSNQIKPVRNYQTTLFG